MKIYEALVTALAFVALGIFVDDHFFWAALILVCVVIVSYLVTMSEDKETDGHSQHH